MCGRLGSGAYLPVAAAAAARVEATALYMANTEFSHSCTTTTRPFVFKLPGPHPRPPTELQLRTKITPQSVFFPVVQSTLTPQCASSVLYRATLPAAAAVGDPHVTVTCCSYLSAGYAGAQIPGNGASEPSHSWATARP